MTLLEKLDCNLDKGFLFTLVSNYSSGKTTILSIIASELVTAGKNVVYVTSEENPRYLQRKFMNLLDLNKDLKGKLIIKKTTNALPYLTALFQEDRDIDTIILDGYFGNKDNIKEFAVSKQISILETKQLARELKGVMTKTSTELKFMSRSDIVVNLVRDHEFKKLTALDKIKNVILFWKPKAVENELLKLTVLKNRSGKDGLFIEYPIDFAKINKL